MSVDLVPILKRTCAIVLAGLLTCLNVGALELHVHADDHDGRGHRHGPAVHAHDAAPADGHTEIGTDEAGPVIPVVMSGLTGVRGPDPIVVVSRMADCPPPAAAVGLVGIIVACAHGPPGIDHRSLRAPPVSVLA